MNTRPSNAPNCGTQANRSAGHGGPALAALAATAFCKSCVIGAQSSLGFLRLAHPTRNRRPGLVVPAMLVVLVLVTSIFGVWAKSIVQNRRHWRVRQNAAQARWLAESGLRRAVARYAESPDYTGETWVVPEQVFGRSRAGRVVLTITARPETPSLLRITSQADFPDHPTERVRHSETMAITAVME